MAMSVTRPWTFVGPMKDHAQLFGGGGGGGGGPGGCFRIVPSSPSAARWRAESGASRSTGGPCGSKNASAFGGVSRCSRGFGTRAAEQQERTVQQATATGRRASKRRIRASGKQDSRKCALQDRRPFALRALLNPLALPGGGLVGAGARG